MRWKENNPNLEFEEVICVYINDCMQYLKAKQLFKAPDLKEQEFTMTKDQDLVYYGLRELKDLCMYVAGEIPLNWKGN